MKYLLKFFLLVMLLVSSSCIAQNEDKEIIAMLNQFYIKYNSAWLNLEGNQLVKELALLKQKYCSRKLNKELEEDSKIHGLDHDALIKDHYSDLESLKKMTIIKKSKNDNEYIVSYYANTEDPANKPMRINISIYVSVIKENGAYKIDAVK